MSISLYCFVFFVVVACVYENCLEKLNTYFLSSIRMCVSGTVGNMELILATVASVSAAVTLFEKEVSCCSVRPPRPILGVCGLERIMAASS